MTTNSSAIILILVIEDEDNLREGICSILEHYGYEVISAATGAEGIKLILNKIPDIIICDIMLPDISGYEVFERVKQMSKSIFNSKVNLLSTAFIFLTAKATRSDIRLGMNMGADDYISKPFSKEELFLSISARLDKLQELKRLQKREQSFAIESHHFSNSVLKGLTKKEAYIFDLISQGYTSEDIAKILFLSRKTIENHRNNISRKLKLNGPNSLVNYAIRSKGTKTLKS